MITQGVAIREPRKDKEGKLDRDQAGNLILSTKGGHPISEHNRMRKEDLYKIQDVLSH